MLNQARNATWAEVVDALPSAKMGGTTIRILRMLDAQVDRRKDVAEHAHIWWEFSLVR